MVTHTTAGWKPVPTVVIIGTLTVYSSLDREGIFLPRRGVFCERNVCFHEKLTMVKKRIDGG